MLVDFDRGTVQHQGTLIYDILGDQFLKRVPTRLAGSTGETGCTRFSKGRTAPAGPARVSLYSANTKFH